MSKGGTNNPYGGPSDNDLDDPYAAPEVIQPPKANRTGRDDPDGYISPRRSPNSIITRSRLKLAAQLAGMGILLVVGGAAAHRLSKRLLRPPAETAQGPTSGQEKAPAAKSEKLEVRKVSGLVKWNKKKPTIELSGKVAAEMGGAVFSILSMHTITPRRFQVTPLITVGKGEKMRYFQFRESIDISYTDGESTMWEATVHETKADE